MAVMSEQTIACLPCRSHHTMAEWSTDGVMSAFIVHHDDTQINLSTCFRDRRSSPGCAHAGRLIASLVVINSAVLASSCLACRYAVETKDQRTQTLHVMAIATQARTFCRAAAGACSRRGRKLRLQSVCRHRAASNSLLVSPIIISINACRWCSFTVPFEQGHRRHCISHAS